jgi:hypothetical protein
MIYSASVGSHMKDHSNETDVFEDWKIIQTKSVGQCTCMELAVVTALNCRNCTVQ